MSKGSLITQSCCTPIHKAGLIMFYNASIFDVIIIYEHSLYLAIECMQVH